MANPRVRFEFKANPSFRDLQGRFTKAHDGLLKDVRSAIRPLGSRFVAIAKEEAPGERFPESIRFRTYIRGSEVGFTTSMLQPLGNFIILGTDGHPIPKRPLDHPLRFFWENGPDGPDYYYFWHVNHPGTKPNPFLDRAYERWWPEAEREARRITVNYEARIAS